MRATYPKLSAPRHHQPQRGGRGGRPGPGPCAQDADTDKWVTIQEHRSELLGGPGTPSPASRRSMPCQEPGGHLGAAGRARRRVADRVRGQGERGDGPGTWIARG